MEEQKSHAFRGTTVLRPTETHTWLSVAFLDEPSSEVRMMEGRVLWREEMIYIPVEDVEKKCSYTSVGSASRHLFVVHPFGPGSRRERRGRESCMIGTVLFEHALSPPLLGRRAGMWGLMASL